MNTHPTEKAYRLSLLDTTEGYDFIVDMFEGPWAFIEGVIREALPKRTDFNKFVVDTIEE